MQKWLDGLVGIVPDGKGFSIIPKRPELMSNGQPHGRSQAPRTWTMDRLRRRAFVRGDCWLWAGAVCPQGYGFATIAHRTVKAHRIAFVLANGYFPSLVMHSCDKPSCVNPAHLSAGTHKENTQDAARKGLMAYGERHWTKAPGAKAGLRRRVSGERNPQARLTESDVLEIRRRLSTGCTQRSLCSVFGVTPMTINRIVNGKGWTHV